MEWQTNNRFSAYYNAMNESECSSLIESVAWTEPGNLISLAILAFINVLVIVGNCLVIAAVFCSHKLRSVTNFFIVSLAVADLLVGIAVLPFSATWEVFKVWIFGDIWCRIWLAVDVWMCTASILNLCAISLDRYVAVTRPVTYPSIMSTKRAKSLIAGIWVLSFVICFPPLVGWKDQKTQDDSTYRRGNQTFVSVTPAPSPPPPCPWTCELTNDAGYVVYSALGSFYIPMFVMLFFYWRIYKAAVRTTRAINQGFRTTKGSKASGDTGNTEETLTLRIHRGRGAARTTNQNDSMHSAGSTQSAYLASPSAERNSRPTARKHDQIKISVSNPPPSEVVSMPATPTNISTLIPTMPQNQNASHENNDTICVGRGESKLNFAKIEETLSGTQSRDQSPKSNRKQGRRIQVKKFRMETKAAKTLAIIVGGFILCWCPFFTVYMVSAFCDQCINPIVFSILFWLGYCNSAVNPLVYALFSKDFREAFYKIICNIFCRKSMNRGGGLFKRASDMSHGKMRPSPLITPFIDRSAEEIRMR